MLSGEGMPRTSGDEDGDAGPFSTLACLGNRGHFGEGKPPPPTLTPMQHYGPLLYIEQKEPCHCTVRQGSGAKDAVVSGGKVEGEHGEGI